jgi:large subunit ribosomal protein L14
MIQLRSVLTPADNTGAKRLKVIGVHRGNKGVGSLGDLVTCVVDQADPQGSVQDSQIIKAVIVRLKKEARRPDGSHVRFDDNAAVIIDPKTKNPKGTRIFGPIAREVKDRGYAKIASLAPEVV